MPTWVICVVIAIIVIMLVLWFLITGKKEKQKREKNKERDLAFTEALNKSKQHLKYRASFRLSMLLSLIIDICVPIAIMTILFVPIFQVKTELFGVTLAKENFSAYDNYKVLKQTGADYKMQIMVIIGFAGFAFIAVVCGITTLKKIASDSERSTLKTFLDMKFADSVIILDNSFGISDLIEVVLCMVFQALLLTTNFFKQDIGFPCNAVSGYIAIPIICFAVSLGIEIYNVYLINKVRNAIKNEVVVLEEAKKEVTEKKEA